MPAYPLWMLQLPALLPSSRAWQGWGCRQGSHRGLVLVWQGGAHRASVAAVRKLPGNCGSKRCLTLQMLSALFSRDDTFLGLQHQNWWFIHKQRNSASDSSLIFFMDFQQGRKEVKGRNNCKTLFLCCNNGTAPLTEEGVK